MSSRTSHKSGHDPGPILISHPSFVPVTGIIPTIKNLVSGITGAGGRASARETAARVAAGAVAKGVLDPYQIKIQSYTKGRHDICAIPRINMVCESMLALVITDHILRQKTIGKDFSPIF